MKRLAVVGALAATAACGTVTTLEAGAPPAPAVAHENPHPDLTVVEAADPTGGLDQAITDSAARRAAAARSARSRPRPVTPARVGPRPAGDGDVRTLTSTAYCLTGRTASGAPVRRGTVAMNGVPLGSVWQVIGGGTYTVADRIGHGSGFDIAMPGDCDGAKAYGRRTITVRRVS